MNFKNRWGTEFYLTLTPTVDGKEFMLTIQNKKKDYGDTFFIPSSKMPELLEMCKKCTYHKEGFEPGIENIIKE